MCILILSFAHGFIHQADELIGHGKIRESLAQVDGLVLERKCAHDRKNGRAGAGEFAL